MVTMDKELFDQLHQSMKEAAAIAKGEILPSRIFMIERPKVNTGSEISEHSKALSAAKPKSYSTLRTKMTPESRAVSAEQTQAILQEIQAGDSVGKGQ